jgi:hypothetical protein
MVGCAAILREVTKRFEEMRALRRRLAEYASGRSRVIPITGFECTGLAYGPPRHTSVWVYENEPALAGDSREGDA